MRNLLFTSILVLTFCICSFAQTNATTPCPTVSVIGPDFSPKANEPQIFSASVSEEAKNYKIEYKWSVHNGEILEGQGTPTIKVLQKQESIGENLTATVEFLGLPKGCERSESGTAPMCECVTSILIDEFSEPISQIDKARIDNIFTVLENDPTAQLFVILAYKENTSQKKIRKREQKIFNSLTKSGIERAGITLIKGSTDADVIRFYIVPAGGEPPIL